MVDFGNIFDLMKEKYIKIFDSYYPTYGSRGFTEKNLSAIFVESYKELVPTSIAWFEAPLESVKKENGYNDNKHMDVVIFDADNNAAIFIESKRIYNKKKELQAINDLQRLRNENNRKFLCSQYTKFIREHYCIVLADIWTDEKQKIKRFGRWVQGDIFEEGTGEYMVRRFDDYETPHTVIAEQYKLLGYIEKIVL